MHEILGHGMTMAYTDKDGGIATSPELDFALVDNKDILFVSSLGGAFKEAIAQIITSKACNKKYTTDDTHYVVYIQYLELLLKSLDIKDYEYASKGTKYLVNQMKKNGIEDAIDYIHDIDSKKTYFEAQDQFVALTCDLDTVESCYLINIISNKYPNIYNKDELETFIDKCLKSSNNIIVYDNYEGNEGLLWENGVEGEFINFDWIKGNTLANFTTFEDAFSFQKKLK
jgi:hypothetical protein